MNYNFCALAKIRRAAAILLVFALSLGIVFGTAGCSEPQKERFQKTYLDAFDTAISVVGYSDRRRPLQKWRRLMFTMSL